MPNYLIYGANGYTATLIAQEAVARGQRPILAGRNADAVTSLARRLSLDSRIFSLDDPAALDAGLRDVAAVLHCAGPFMHTARAMADACLRCRVHYLDITGEIGVFEQLARRDAAAKAAGVMLLPGVGLRRGADGLSRGASEAASADGDETMSRLSGEGRFLARHGDDDDRESAARRSHPARRRHSAGAGGVAHAPHRLRRRSTRVPR